MSDPPISELHPMHRIKLEEGEREAKGVPGN